MNNKTIFDPDVNEQKAEVILTDGTTEAITYVVDEEYSDLVVFHIYFRGKRYQTYSDFEELKKLGVRAIRLTRVTNIHL